MSKNNLNERVSALENQVDQLLADRSTTNRTKDWRRTRGAFSGDGIMKQVFTEGRKIRQGEKKNGKAPSKKRSPRT